MNKDVTPFSCYIDYLALKRHFTVDNYDYFKYNGKVKANYASFENRNDRYSFEKLSNKHNPHEILLAHISSDPNAWIGNILSDDKTYKEWKKTQSLLLYTFSEDCKKLDEDFNSNFIVKDGDYPHALKLYMHKQITKETLILLNRILKFSPYWNKEINDPVVWPNIFFNLKKYSSFLDIDLYKYKDALRKVVTQR